MGNEESENSCDCRRFVTAVRRKENVKDCPDCCKEDVLTVEGLVKESGDLYLMYDGVEDRDCSRKDRRCRIVVV